MRLEQMQSGLANSTVLEEGTTQFTADGRYAIVAGVNLVDGRLDSYCIEVTGGGGGCETGDSETFELLLWDGAPVPYLAWRAPAGVDAVRVMWDGGQTTTATVKRPGGEESLGFAATLMPIAGAEFSYVGVGKDGRRVTGEFTRPAVGRIGS